MKSHVSPWYPWPTTSPPAWWCGLKSDHDIGNILHLGSPPAWWCGLKLPYRRRIKPLDSSPPAWWCGLKSSKGYPPPVMEIVTTCVVVWIEICKAIKKWCDDCVTTCVVVWIEITLSSFENASKIVTTCVVVWIEISSGHRRKAPVPCHHLRGGVD